MHVRLRDETADQMRALASVCSGGEPDGAREALYRSLVRNVHDEALKKAFPIAGALLGPGEWEDAVSRFMLESPPTSPALWRMPRQFVDWAIRSGLGDSLGRPYLSDLLEFEWVEIEVFMMEDRETAEHAQGNLLTGRPVLNPHRVILNLLYPIFRVPAAEAAREPGDYHLVCFRHPRTLSAAFLEIGALGMRVLEIVESEPLAGYEAILRASREIGTEPPNSEEALAFYSSLAELGVVLGVATGRPVE